MKMTLRKIREQYVAKNYWEAVRRGEEQAKAEREEAAKSSGAENVEK